MWALTLVSEWCIQADHGFVDHFQRLRLLDRPRLFDQPAIPLDQRAALRCVVPGTGAAGQRERDDENTEHYAGHDKEGFTMLGLAGEEQ